jgi:microcystin-dependent protein
MGGTAASRLTSGGSGVAGATLGASGGAQTHTLTNGQLPTSAIGTGGSTIARGSTVSDLRTIGNNEAHNNTQPTIILNYIIKT